MCGYKNGNEGGTSDVEEKELSWLMEWNGLRCFFSLFFPFHIQLQSEAVKAAEAVKHCLARSHTQMRTHHKNAWVVKENEPGKVVLNKGKLVQEGKLVQKMYTGADSG